MGGKVLLDTNIVIGLHRNEPTIVQKIDELKEVLIPIIVIGELYFGAEKSVRITENIAVIDEFVEDNVIVGCDETTARVYGWAKNRLKAKGRPIPDNDIWIAAIAIQHDLTLVSRDKHFGEIDTLKLENWLM